MEMIDFRHAVNQIIRRFWVIVLAAFLGIVLSALFFFVFEKREPETTQVSETKKAYFMLAMTKDARQNFSSGNILDYTVSITGYYAGFLNSEYSRRSFHQTIMETFPELNEENYPLSTFNSHLAIRSENMSIVVEVKPWNLENTEEELLAEMDPQAQKELAARLQNEIYRLVISAIRNTDGLGLADFYISDYEMDTFVSETVIEGDSFPIKKCLIAGIFFGGAAAGLILVLALLDTSVKDDRDLQEKTDLSILAILHRKGWTKKNDMAQIGQAMENADYQNSYELLSTKIAVHSEKTVSQLYVFMGTDAIAEELVCAVAQGLTERLKKNGYQAVMCSEQEALSESHHEGIIVCAAKSALESSEGIRLATKGNIVLVVRQYRTKYKKLSELADVLRQMDASVLGAVLTDFHKEKWAL